jgi:acyl-CoA synthetase (NDP forming)
MLAAIRAKCPEAQINGIVVAEQVPPGVELIVGIKQDAQFGPVVVVGLGGTLAEILDQVALAIPPLTPDSARQLLQEFPGHQVLEAFRGRPAADVDAAADVLVKVGELALDGDGLFSELDINPLVVLPRGDGCRVVDARLLRETENSTRE